jgi:dUTP pyrophosphatase
MGGLCDVIDVAFRRLRPDAVVPERAYDGDAGLDLAACDPAVLEPGERMVVPTGLAVDIPDGHAGFVQPRSGLAARFGIGIVNSPGLIDSGYRGEICVVLLNTSREPFSVEPGMRIAQLVIVPVPSVRVVEVDELTSSERGVRGFGSSSS